MDNIQSKITPERLQELTRILQKYKTGKAHLERRVVSAENWWKLRNSSEEMKATSLDDSGFRSRSGWLHNVIVSKHADAMEAYPEPNILPREPNDREEARMLSSIVPVVMEQNLFEDTYCDAMWQKLKTGTGVYKVTWDADKLGGLGDISIERVDLLNLFWEPGVRDIQDSRYFYHTALHDNDILEQRYPQLEGKLKGSPFTATKFLYDDAVDTSGKTTVIDCYYKLWQDGRTVLHYVKYVGDTVLYATEDEGKPLYDHGLYPFVFDSLFPVEGSPCGYGFVDLCSNAQTAIDLMDTAFVKNTMVGAMPRYFRRNDGGVHEDEFLDLSTPLVTVDGNLGDDALKIIDYRPLSGNYMEFQAGKVNELRETSGNTETATGSTSQGVTAASAIAALQEASGKGSRDSTKTSYRAYSQVVTLVIELIRQFYDVPRQFRITGSLGEEQFVQYGNAGLRGQPLGMLGGQDMGMRLPVFDIEVKAQKAAAYTKMSQNELALQFYSLGFFDPAQADPSLMCLDMMEFDGKDALMQKISQMGGMYQQLIMYQQMALTLAQKYEPNLAAGLMTAITGEQPQQRQAPADVNLDAGQPQEQTRVQNARTRSRQASQPGGAE